MPLTYTTKEAIANRLKGRLQVGGSQLPFGNTAVDDGLIEQVGAQVEARVNAQLSSVYRLPLVGSHPVLSSVVEKLVICELMGTHFVGQEGTEEGGFGAMMCRQGRDELALIVSGQVQLDGELIAGGSTETRNPNYSKRGTRSPLPDSSRDVSKIKW